MNKAHRTYEMKNERKEKKKTEKERRNEKKKKLNSTNFPLILLKCYSPSLSKIKKLKIYKPIRF